MRSLHELQYKDNEKFPRKFPRWETEEETIKPQQSIKQRRINFQFSNLTKKQTNKYGLIKVQKKDDKSENISEESIYLILKPGIYKSTDKTTASVIY